MTFQVLPGLRSAEHGTGSAGVECQPYPVPLVIHTPGGVEPGPRLYNVIITVTPMRVFFTHMMRLDKLIVSDLTPLPSVLIHGGDFLNSFVNI